MGKMLLLIAVVAFALGVWLALGTHDPAARRASVETGLAVAFACTFFFSLWLWQRAKPGSGDAFVAPTLVWLAAAMLAGILPRVMWPGASRLHMAGSIASVVIATVLCVTRFRQWRQLSRVARN
jgi:hypothetical protein